MTSTLIDPNQVFDLEGARAAIGVKKSCLQRELRLRRLRYSKRAGKVWITGEWLLNWIREGEMTKPRRMKTADDFVRNGA